MHNRVECRDDSEKRFPVGQDQEVEVGKLRLVRAETRSSNRGEVYARIPSHPHDTLVYTYHISTMMLTSGMNTVHYVEI